MIKEAESSLKIPQTFCHVHTDRSVLSVCLDQDCQYRGMFCYQCIKYHYKHIDKTFEIKEFLNLINENINDLSFNMLPTSPSPSLKDVAMNKDNLLRQKELVIEAVTKYVELAIDIAETKIDQIETKNPPSQDTQQIQELTGYQEKFFDLGNLQPDELYDLLIFFSRFIHKEDDRIEIITQLASNSGQMSKNQQQSIEVDFDTTCQNLRNSELVLQKLTGILDHLPPDDRSAHQKLSCLKIAPQQTPRRFGQPQNYQNNNSSSSNGHNSYHHNSISLSNHFQRANSNGLNNESNHNNHRNHYSGNSNYNNSQNNGFNNQQSNGYNKQNNNQQNSGYNNQQNSGQNSNKFNQYINQSNQNSNNNISAPTNQSNKDQFENNVNSNQDNNDNTSNSGVSNFLQKFQQKLNENKNENSQNNNSLNNSFQNNNSSSNNPQNNGQNNNSNSNPQSSTNNNSNNNSNQQTLNSQQNNSKANHQTKSQQNSSQNQNNQSFNQSQSHFSQQLQNGQSQNENRLSYQQKKQQNGNSKRNEILSEQRLGLRSVEHFCDALEVGFNNIWCVSFKTKIECALNGFYHLPIFIYDSTVGASLESAHLQFSLFEGSSSFNKKLYDQTVVLKKTNKHISPDETNIINVLDKISINTSYKLRKNSEYTIVIRNKSSEQEDSQSLKQLYILYGDEQADELSNQPESEGSKLMTYIKTNTTNLSQAFEGCKLITQNNDSLENPILTDYFIPYLSLSQLNPEQQYYKNNFYQSSNAVEEENDQKTPKRSDYEHSHSGNHYNSQYNTSQNQRGGFKDFLNNFKNGTGFNPNNSSSQMNNNSENNQTNENDFNKYNRSNVGTNKRKYLGNGTSQREYSSNNNGQSSSQYNSSSNNSNNNVSSSSNNNSSSQFQSSSYSSNNYEKSSINNGYIPSKKQKK